MAESLRLICRSDALCDGGDGVRFMLDSAQGPVAAFAVRYAGAVHAYLNRCAHVPVELDWQPGRFFDFTGFYLICAVHGAHYEPHTGRCAMGPCKGRRLRKLAVVERDGAVFVDLSGLSI